MSSQTSKPSRQETYDAEERYKEAMMNNMSDEQWAAAGVAKARYAISFPSLTEFQLGLAHDMECGTRSDILGTDLSTELDGGIPQPNEWRDKHHLHRNNLLAGIHHDLYTIQPNDAETEWTCGETGFMFNAYDQSEWSGNTQGSEESRAESTPPTTSLRRPDKGRKVKRETLKHRLSLRQKPQ